MRLLRPRGPSGPAERRKLRRLWPAVRGVLALAGALTVLAVPAWVWGVGWWLDFSDEPQPSDFLVVLAGDYGRPHGAAELFKTGVAPTLWFAKTWRPWGQEEALRIGVPFPAEEELDRAILLKRGVPEAALRQYGEFVTSTVAEARAFKAAAKPEGKKVLVYTSRPHARRAKLVFRRELPDSEVRVVGMPDPYFTRRWWTSQPMAYAAVLETCKLAYWLAGGRFFTAKR